MYLWSHDTVHKPHLPSHQLFRTGKTEGQSNLLTRLAKCPPLRNDPQWPAAQGSPFSSVFECWGGSTQNPTVSSPGLSSPAHSRVELGAWGLAGLDTKWDSVCISQIKSAGSLYEHSNRFTDVKKLKGTVHVCSLNSSKVSMSTLPGLCTQNFVSLFSPCLPLHSVKVCSILFHVSLFLNKRAQRYWLDFSYS